MRIKTFDEFQETRYFAALDGLRGASILLVLLHHVPAFSSPLISTLQKNGGFGVALFFVISGFLICTLLLREERENGKIELLKFFGRRALRLLPLYYATLALHALLIFGFDQFSPENQQLFWDKLPSYLFYHSNWLATATEGPFFFAWSLAVEEQFYLSFGLLLTILPRRYLSAVIGAAVALKFGTYQAFGNVDEGSLFWRILFSYQEAILLGVLLGFALARRHTYERLARFLRPIWSVPALILAAAIWLWTHPMESQSTWDAQLTYVLMTLIVGGVATRPSIVILSTGFLPYVGRISYGIYLLHMFVVSAVKKTPAGAFPPLVLIFSAVVVIAIASLVYRYFEQPIITFYKQRLAATPSPK